MPLYRVKNTQQAWYGDSIGILILDTAYPCIPGNVGNATTFDLSGRCTVVRDASIDRLVNRRDRFLVSLP